MRKIGIIFDIENWLWKSEIGNFRSLDLERVLIYQNFFLWKSAIFHSIKLPFDVQAAEKILHVIYYVQYHAITSKYSPLSTCLSLSWNQFWTKLNWKSCKMRLLCPRCVHVTIPIPQLFYSWKAIFCQNLVRPARRVFGKCADTVKCICYKDLQCTTFLRFNTIEYNSGL